MAGRDLFAPRYQIFINDELIPDEITQFISSVKVEDDAEMFDKLTLDISALQTTLHGNVLDLLNSKMFSTPQLLRVDMGYGRVMATVGAGEIVKVKPSFGSDGISMQVIAYDPFHRLAKKKHPVARSFNKKISEIFSEVISGYPSAIFVNEIPKGKDIVKEITQNVGKTDYEILKSLANSKGLDFFNEFDPKTQKFKFVISQPNDKTKPRFTFKYFIHDDEPLQTLYEFSPEMNNVDQITDIQFRNFDRRTKKKITTFIGGVDDEGTAGTFFKGPKKLDNFKGGSGSKVTFTAFGQHFEIITNRAFNNPKEAKIFTEACLKDRLNNFITGNALVVGVEVLRARVVIEFLGLSDAFNGNYYINRVVHTMSDGQPYLCSLDVRKIVEL